MASLARDARIFVRFARGLKNFLRAPLAFPEAIAMIEAQRRSRESSFLQLVEESIYGYGKSPYRVLLEQAGIEYGDVVELVTREGVEGGLERLYQAGVYITLGEFKGNRPIQRSGFELPVRAEDFDNPLLRRDLELGTSGSRGPARLAAVDFALLRADAACQAVFLRTFALEARPMALWRAAPPGGAGIRHMMIHAKLRRVPERWFSQQPARLGSAPLRSYLLTRFTVGGSRAAGVPIPAPEFVPLDEPETVVRWLGEMRARAAPAWLDASSSAVLRVCAAAKERGIDISQTFFQMGGDAYTPARHRVVAEAGALGSLHYAMIECGTIGVGCPEPVEVDDVHLLEHKVALIQPAGGAGNRGDSAGALRLTTLLPSTPKVMLNVEVGDQGRLSTRSCDCPLGRIGFHRHLDTIRSYEKLTSEGMSILPGDLLVLVEDTLPGAFGGTPADYQFVEEQDGDLRRVSIRVSPRVGRIDEDALIETVLRAISRASRSHQMMAAHWRQGHTLRVIRREPLATASGKILPVHISSQE